MTEQEFRAKLHQSIAGVKMTEEAKRRVIRCMDEPAKEVHPMKKSLVVAVCALVAMMLSITAVASGTRRVNMKGETIPDLSPAYVGDEVSRAFRIAEKQPDGIMARFLVREADGSQNYGRGKMKFRPETLAEVESLLATQERLLCPVRVPDGYTLREAEIHYEGVYGATFSIEGSETIDGCIDMYYLSLSEDERLPVGYELIFENSGGGWLRIAVFMTQGNRFGFQVKDEDVVDVLTIANMDQALLIGNAAYTSLYAEDRMRQNLMTAIPRSIVDGQVRSGWESYTKVDYYIESTQLTEPELLAIFGWQKAE